MEISAFDIWLITRLDAVWALFLALTIASAAATLCSAIGWEVRVSENEAAFALRCFRRSIVALILFALPAIACPTTNEAAAMYIIPKIANNEQVQQLPPKLLNLTDEWIEHLSPPADTDTQ